VGKNARAAANGKPGQPAVLLRITFGRRARYVVDTAGRR